MTDTPKLVPSDGKDISPVQDNKKPETVDQTSAVGPEPLQAPQPNVSKE